MVVVGTARSAMTLNINIQSSVASPALRYVSHQIKIKLIFVLINNTQKVLYF